MNALEQEDFEWGFNCDIEEDNVLLKINEHLFETPAINLVYHQTSKLLGESVHRKFGSDIPAKLNFVDGTDDSNNLSLEVYPGVDFLKDYFGLQYQQVENYYIMDAKRKSRMYVTLKAESSGQELKQVLSSKQTTKITSLFEFESLEKHDHLAIPQETIHSGGQQAIMLHISTAPQIFKSVLYQNKAEDHTLSPSHEMLIDQALKGGKKEICKNNFHKIKHKAYQEELLACQENALIDISRIWFERELKLASNGTFQIFNLIEGNEIIIESSSAAFKPFRVHYAETFFIPAGVSKYIIKSAAKSRVGLLRVTPKS